MSDPVSERAASDVWRPWDVPDLPLWERSANLLVDAVTDHADEMGHLANSTADELRDALRIAAKRLNYQQMRMTRHLDVLDHFCRVTPDVVLERLREHRPISWDGFTPLDCEACGAPWPCPTEVARTTSGRCVVADGQHSWRVEGDGEYEPFRNICEDCGAVLEVVPPRTVGAPPIDSRTEEADRG